MSLERLTQLLHQPESIRLAFREATTNLPKNLFESVCATFNRDGGLNGGLIGGLFDGLNEGLKEGLFEGLKFVPALIDQHYIERIGSRKTGGYHTTTH